MSVSECVILVIGASDAWNDFAGSRCLIAAAGQAAGVGVNES